MNSLPKSREAFIAAENSDRFWRALKSNIRSDEGPFSLDELVYHQRDGVWRGPVKVLGQDDRVVLVRHGGQVERAHNTQTRRVRAENKEKKVSSEKEASHLEDTFLEKQLTEELVIPDVESSRNGNDILPSVLESCVFYQPNWRESEDLTIEESPECVSTYLQKRRH